MSSSFFWSFLILSSFYGVSYFGFFPFGFFPAVWPWFQPVYSPGFWLFLVYLIATVDEMDFPSLPLVMVYIAGMQYYGAYPVMEYVYSHPGNVVLGCLAYLVIGVVWTIPRLKLYLRNSGVKYTLKSAYDKVKTPNVPRRSQRNKVSPPRSLSPVRSQPDSDSGSDSESDGGQEMGYDQARLEREAANFLSRNKFRIYSWIVYWPFSVVNVLTSDMVRELLDMIFGRFLKRVYLWIIKNAILSVAQESHQD